MSRAANRVRLLLLECWTVSPTFQRMRPQVCSQKFSSWESPPGNRWSGSTLGSLSYTEWGRCGSDKIIHPPWAYVVRFIYCSSMYRIKHLAAECPWESNFVCRNMVKYALCAVSKQGNQDFINILSTQLLELLARCQLWRCLHSKHAESSLGAASVISVMFSL